jgi:hypothetical protein
MLLARLTHTLFLSLACVSAIAAFPGETHAATVAIAAGSPQVYQLRTSPVDRTPEEAVALLKLAQASAFTKTNWNIAQSLEPRTRQSEAPIALNASKTLPAEPVVPDSKKVRVFDHYQVVPAHAEAVYREVEVNY